MEEKGINCSFCGRTKQETDVLIAGTTGHICNLCISQAHEIISEEMDHQSREELADELTLLKPKEIKEHLEALLQSNKISIMLFFHSKICLSIFSYS